LTRAFDCHGVAAREQMLVLPALPHDDYLRVNIACDAMLDTLHWSGGNTSLDALACGLPVVTLPGAFMRGRQSAAMLRIVGAEALVAADHDDYVRIASRLAGDAAWRDQQARGIRDGSGALFNRREPVQAFSDLLLNST
jgi:predicted O-linked N-acetylglucosamine transferase (SPINDLY family)